MKIIKSLLQARLRLADAVEKEDVNEAMRLMEMSKDSLNTSHNMHNRLVLFMEILNRFTQNLLTPILPKIQNLRI